MKNGWFETKKEPPREKGRYMGFFSSFKEGNKRHTCYFDGEKLKIENGIFEGEPKYYRPLAKGPNEVEEKKIYIIDLDGTVCEDIPNEKTEKMKDARLIPGAKKQINKWYENGDYICFFTARDKEEHGEITKNWLKDHGFKYHRIIYNKPRIKDEFNGYHFIDNHMAQATTFKGRWSELVRKTKIIEVFD